MDYSKKPNYPKLKISDDTIERVRCSNEENSTTSSRRRPAQLNITHTTLCRIIWLRIRTILSSQRLLKADHEKRLAYVNFVIEQATADDAFWHSIIMTDEAHFSLFSAVNSQNYLHNAEENPKIIHEELLHDPKVSVRCGVSA